jgi:hypothetical protein
VGADAAKADAAGSIERTSIEEPSAILDAFLPNLLVIDS